MDLIVQYWWAAAIAVVVLVLVVVLLRPRQRVRLSETEPTRAHMAYAKKNLGLAGEAAAAVEDVGREVLEGPAPVPTGTADELTRMKGVGPKFAETLIARGYGRFDRLAALDEDEAARLDEQMGAFRGRIARDRVIEQAGYLAKDDIAGFERKFGKL